MHNRRWSDSATAGDSPHTQSKAPQGRDYQMESIDGCDFSRPLVIHLAPAGL
ncbi:MAG: hypothetical protein LBL62_12410 [Planctomycetaceae bacterium]|nr:hypothetical protein [Planctomycetaceae bacterium]